jgi:hypothetical protein
MPLRSRARSHRPRVSQVVLASVPAGRALDIRPHAHASGRIARRQGGGATHSSAAICANRSTARAGARAFRGINGRHPAPFIPRCPGTRASSRRSRSRTATDECGAEITSTPEPTPRDQQPRTAPSEIGAGVFEAGIGMPCKAWRARSQNVQLSEINQRTGGPQQFTRIVADCRRRGLLPPSGLPP